VDGAVHHDGRRGGGTTAARRDELLDAATDYVLAHGLSSLSIRPLASALGLSHRTLLYYFETKDKLVLSILERIRERDKLRIREYLGRAPLTSGTELLRAAWGFFSAPERTEYIRFFHDVFALGLHGPPYQAWIQTIVHGRNDLIAAALSSMGVPAERARAGAVLITAAVRGLQLHLLTTGDRAITDAAFEELLLALEARLSIP
jgi:AcrR family transcriptional regulator